MVPSIIRRWQETKTAIQAERQRILTLVDNTYRRVKEACGQKISHLPVQVGVFTYTFHASYGEGCSPWTDNLPLSTNTHWSGTIGHWELVLSAFKLLTESEVEMAMLRLLEQQS